MYDENCLMSKMYGICIDFPINNRIRPNTIDGTEIKTAINTVAMLSINFPGFLPTQIPSGIPINSVSKSPRSPTSAEVPKRCQTNEFIVLVGNSEYEIPKSPRNIPLMYKPYRRIKGRSKPY